MTIETLSKEIFNELDSKRENLNKEFLEFTTNLESNFNKKISKFKESSLNKFDNENSFNKQKILGDYKKKSSRLILSKKQELITNLYNNLLFDIENLKSNIRKDLISNLLSYALNNFNFQKIICSRKDFVHIKEFLKDKDLILKNQKKSININNISYSIQEISGIILFDESDSQKLDLTFKTILDVIFENNEDEIQELLFE